MLSDIHILDNYEHEPDIIKALLRSIKELDHRIDALQSFINLQDVKIDQLEHKLLLVNELPLEHIYTTMKQFKEE